MSAGAIASPITLRVVFFLRDARLATSDLRTWHGVDLLTLALDLATTKIDRVAIQATRAQAIASLIKR